MYYLFVNWIPPAISTDISLVTNRHWNSCGDILVAPSTITIYCRFTLLKLDDTTYVWWLICNLVLIYDVYRTILIYLDTILRVGLSRNKTILRKVPCRAKVVFLVYIRETCLVKHQRSDRIFCGKTPVRNRSSIMVFSIKKIRRPIEIIKHHNINYGVAYPVSFWLVTVVK